jgi:hypothetical protein
VLVEPVHSCGIGGLLFIFLFLARESNGVIGSLGTHGEGQRAAAAQFNTAILIGAVAATKAAGCIAFHGLMPAGV